MRHLLVVDDDSEIRSLLLHFLVNKGFIVSAAPSAAIARALSRLLQFDLIILDIMMPEESGIDFLSKLSRGTPPVVMLTAMADVDDRINGLELGAVDYIAKPFEPQELLLRIKNILEHKKFDSHVVRFGEYQFDIANNILMLDNQQVYLTTTEAMLLSTLAKKHGQVVTREELANLMGTIISERAIDAQIARLRSKIEKDSKRPVYLDTVRNKGYILKRI